VIDPEDLAFGADQGSYGQCWLSGTRSNIQNYVPTANQPIFDKSSRDRRKHLPDDFAVLFPEPRGITPYAYNLLVGLHQQKYTYQAVDGEFGNSAKGDIVLVPQRTMGTCQSGSRDQNALPATCTFRGRFIQVNCCDSSFRRRVSQ
jgi:hypothetical protein